MSEEEGLAQVLWIADPDHTTSWSQAPLSTKRRCRAMASAVLAAIGGTEAALRAALDRLLTASSCAQSEDGAVDPLGCFKEEQAAEEQCETVLSLTPSAAAEQVRAERAELKALRRYRNARVALESATAEWFQGLSEETAAAMHTATAEHAAAVAALAPFEAAKVGGGAGAD